MMREGQSGAGMIRLYGAPPQSMSPDAARIVRVSASLRACLDHPEQSPWFDNHVFELDCLLRRCATDYIAQAVTDLDKVAFLSREAAAGRRSPVFEAAS